MGTFIGLTTIVVFGFLMRGVEIRDNCEKNPCVFDSFTDVEEQNETNK